MVSFANDDSVCRLVDVLDFGLGSGNHPRRSRITDI
jgi:hypothetical protein